MPATRSRSSLRRQAKTDLPPKNRVGNFFATFDSGVWTFSTQPAESHQETFDTSAKSVSGRSNWLNRDPIGEREQLNVYSFIENDSINSFDDLGLRRRRIGNLAGADAFVYHFYFGQGAPVDIETWGYLSAYQSASDVKLFISEVKDKIKAKISCCAKADTKWNDSYRRLVDATDGLYVMGNGHLNASWRCQKFRSLACRIHYNIRDSFEDPVDLESHINRRLPRWVPKIPDPIVQLGGTPYPLIAQWAEPYTPCDK